MANLLALELKLEFVCDEGDEFGIRGFAFRIGNRVPKEALEGIQIPTIPSHLDGVADGSLHSTGRGLECFRHLGVQYLRDGVSLPDGKQG